MESASPASIPLQSRKYIRAISQVVNSENQRSEQQRQELINIVEKLQNQSESFSSEADFECQEINEGTIYCKDNLPLSIKNDHMKTLEEIFFGDDNQKSPQNFRSIENEPSMKTVRVK